MEVKICKYWVPEIKLSADNARTFEELDLIPLKVLKMMPKDKPIIEVCGPITSGGLWDVEENIFVFKECILQLQLEGLNVFDQIPLQEAFGRLLYEWRMSGGVGYCKPILKIYKNIFKSGFIKEGVFIPGYQTSVGARWEKRTMIQLGIKTSYFDSIAYGRIIRKLLGLKVIEAVNQ